MGLGAPEILIILAAVLLLLGSTRLPTPARSLGQASRELRAGTEGTTVTLRNEDNAPHTATADDEKAFDAHVGAGAGGEFTVSGDGEIAYHCKIHDYMKGVIRITG